jgi:hypothetical protein
MAGKVRLAARETMMRHGYDPMEVLVQHAQSETASADVKLDLAKVLLPYMYPKLSNVTMEAEVTNKDNSESRVMLLQKILGNPELADAAQRLSIAAAEVALNVDASEYASGMVQ